MTVLIGSIYSGEVKKALLAVLVHLETSPETHQMEHMFFSGEFDGSQTTFESKSNKLKIGVRTKSSQIGYILLFYLRMIADDNFGLALWVFDDLEDNDKRIGNFAFAVDDLIARYEIQEKEYGSVFPIDQPATVELIDHNGRYTVSRVAAEIDLWDLDRVRQAIEDKDFTTINF